MPAPRRPNTAPATAALIRRGQETMAAKLREAGWTVTPPPEDTPPHPAQLMPDDQWGTWCEDGWTDDHRAFRDWLVSELRTAGCEIRTLSPEGMARVTVEHMVNESWEVRRRTTKNGGPPR